MRHCRNCQEPLEEENEWCEVCENYNPTETNFRWPNYQLILENKAQKESTPKQAQVFKKQLSPLRYPGGKSRLIEYTAQKIDWDFTQTIVSPFMGGASMELSFLDAGLCQHVVLNDYDTDLVNFFHHVFFDAHALIEHIQSVNVNQSFYLSSHDLVVSGTLNNHNESDSLKAFRYLVNNRCSYSGIYNAGMQGGKSGKGLLDRYNPKNLIKRIEYLAQFKDHITLLNQHAFDVIGEYAQHDHTTLVIDPPYIEKGNDLYRVSFESLGEHTDLFRLLHHLQTELPAADIVLFYDDAKELDHFPYLPNETKVLNRYFSI